LFRNQADEFDLIVCDMTMPHMTGEQLAKEMMRIRPDIPVILCTGYSNRINQELALQIGVKAFVYKPIKKNDLALTIRNGIGSCGINHTLKEKNAADDAPLSATF